MRIKIAFVEEGSIAHALEICAGDFLLGINGRKILDFFDYELLTLESEVRLLIRKANGEMLDAAIDKDEGCGLGLVFANQLMARKKRCENSCIFCFVDQQPEGLRRSLYVKDDDWRLSFTCGSYITLTNMDYNEAKRIISLNISPLKVSVHTCDMVLRQRMMGNSKAGNLETMLDMFSGAGIIMDFQVVLCRGINDGTALEQTIRRLGRFAKRSHRRDRPFGSLAIVPAGLTRFRANLSPIEPYTAEQAREIILRVSKYQQYYRAKIGTSFAFLADEWYLLAGMQLPGSTHYGDYPQLDNGVGMVRLFMSDFLARHEKAKVRRLQNLMTIGIITGESARGFMTYLARKFEAKHHGVKVRIHSVKNEFFGGNVTVSGLLTGYDIIRQLAGNVSADVLFVPRNMFKHQSSLMLDGTRRRDLQDALGVRVRIGSADGGRFCAELLRAMTEKPTEVL